MCYCPTPTLHLNLALTGDGAFLFSPQKTYSVWFISVLNYGDTENVLINHLLLVIPMSYPSHYTNLCPHKPHKHAHTDTHARAHTHTHLEQWAADAAVPGSSRGFGALLKGLTSVVDNSCQSRDSNPQPQVTSPMLYPLEPQLPHVKIASDWRNWVCYNCPRSQCLCTNVHF